MKKGQVKVLMFDVGGSIFDWQTATRTAVAALAKSRDVTIDDRAFVFDWRRRMFETLAEVRAGSLSWRNADRIHRDVLGELAEEYPALALSNDDLDELNRAWHRMDVWGDVPAALSELRNHYIVAILTVLSLSIVVDSSKHAGIDWDAYLSCEFLGIYKPEPEAYQSAARLLGAAPEETMMVAVHPPDLLAAQRAGLKTAYVRPKLEEMGSRGETASFDIIAENYSHLAELLCT